MQFVRYHVENARRFLADHWAIRLLVAPVLFLATVVALFAVASGNAPGDVLTLVAAYLAFSLTVVLVGLALEAVGRRLTGGSLLGP
jgi:hypothetical protein